MWVKFRRIFVICLLLVFSFCILFYSGEVSRRNHASHWQFEKSKFDEGRYTAKYAYVGRGAALLRIYETKSDRLLAERQFHAAVPVGLIWMPNGVQYSTNDDSWFYEGVIDLPPNRIDRLLAHLP